MNKLEQAAKKITAAVPMVQAIMASRNEAFEEERAARRELLTALVSELAPVLDAVSTLTVTDGGSIRGVKIAGSSVFLRSDSVFVAADGSPVMLDSVLASVSIETIVVFFADLLERHANGNSGFRARQAKERAELYRAVGVLLRKGTV